MNIFKSFEIFFREPLSVLREKFIQIVSVQSSGYSHMTSINAEIMDKTTQITVVNNEKIYNLFQTVMYKQKLKEEHKLRSMVTTGNTVVLGQLLKRQ